jgi:hypothetical protein
MIRAIASHVPVMDNNLKVYNIWFLGMQTFPREHFSQEAFITAFAVIISRAVYLPTADLFALVSGYFSTNKTEKGNP